MRRPLAAFAAALAFALAGCATPPSTPEPTARDGPPNLWTGRFAATVSDAAPDGSGAREERSSGRFSLRVEDARTQLELSSPLGQTMAQVWLADGHATLLAADGKTWQAPSAEALTEQVFGWRVPLGNLPDWLEGRIAEPTERDGTRVVAGREHGWSVRIDAHDAGRPRRLALDWPVDAAAGERRLSLRLVIDSALRVDARP
jgi:outer membrane lipoprotein LolB